MATETRSIEQIRYNTTQGVFSMEDQQTLLSRYEQLMQDVKEIDPILWKQYKRKEKER